VLKFRSCISLIFLFAVTVIQAHSIIPHHHHAEPYLYGCTQPVNDTKDKPAEAPWHCHAFNQVVYVERLLLIKSRPVSPFPVDSLQSICQQAPEYSARKAYIFIHPIMPEHQNPMMLPAPGRAPPVFMGV
jgi:hypothetical protein